MDIVSGQLAVAGGLRRRSSTASLKPGESTLANRGGLSPSTFVDGLIEAPPARRGQRRRCRLRRRSSTASLKLEDAVEVHHQDVVSPSTFVDGLIEADAARR